MIHKLRSWFRRLFKFRKDEGPGWEIGHVMTAKQMNESKADPFADLPPTGGYLLSREDIEQTRAVLEREYKPYSSLADWITVDPIFHLVPCKRCGRRTVADSSDEVLCRSCEEE